MAELIKSTVKVHCDCCHKEMLKPEGFSTPHGAMIFSCGKKKCDAVITEVLINCFGSYYGENKRITKQNG